MTIQIWLPQKIIQNKLKYIETSVSNMLYKIIISEDIINIFIDIVNDNCLVSSYFFISNSRASLSLPYQKK